MYGDGSGDQVRGTESVRGLISIFFFHNAHVNITKAQDHVGVTKNSIFDVPGVGQAFLGV